MVLFKSDGPSDQPIEWRLPTKIKRMDQVRVTKSGRRHTVRVKGRKARPDLGDGAAAFLKVRRGLRNSGYRGQVLASRRQANNLLREQGVC